MGTGQSLFAIASMMLLTMITTRINSTILTTQETTQNSKFALAAISLATSKMEYATRLDFDENTIAAPQKNINSNPCTAANRLGKETGETTLNTFDDIDDLNNYTETDSSLTSAVFTTTMKVYYVSQTDPDRISSSVTWHKKVEVRVSSVSMTDTIKASMIFSYWNFR